MVCLWGQYLLIPLITLLPCISFQLIFAIDTFDLNVSLPGKGEGSVTSDPVGILCNNNCSQSYDYITEVTLIAEPRKGSRFVGWSGDCSGADPVCKVIMDNAKNIYAEFYYFPWPLFLPAFDGSATP